MIELHRPAWRQGVRQTAPQTREDYSRSKTELFTDATSDKTKPKKKDRATRTCQVTSQLEQVSAEVVELHLRRQEDVLRFRQREGALVCAGVLLAQCSQTQKSQRGIATEASQRFIYTAATLETLAQRSQNTAFVRTQEKEIHYEVKD